MGLTPNSLNKGVSKIPDAKKVGNPVYRAPPPKSRIGPIFCFAAGTKVSTPNGLIAIENLNIGNEVYSFDFETKNVTVSQIVNTHNNISSSYYEIGIDGSILKATEEHPFTSSARVG